MKQTKTAIIAGASGLIGGHLINLLLNSEEYDTVIALVRKELNISHKKLEQKIVDFNNPDALKISGQDIFCCLGTTIKNAGSEENFRKVDLEYPVALAEATLAAGASNFLVVSSMGAGIRSRFFYSRVKGEMEEEISRLGFLSVGIFRPGMLLGKRKEFRLGELTGKILMQIFSPLIPKKYRAVQAVKVAETVLNFASKGAKGVSVIENISML